MSVIGPPLLALGGVLVCLCTIGAMLALAVVVVAIRQLVPDEVLPRAAAMYDRPHRPS